MSFTHNFKFCPFIFITFALLNYNIHTMLKKISFSVICLLFTLSTVVAQDQKEALKQYVDNMASIEDARSKLEEQVETIDAMESMNQIQSIKITSANTQNAKGDDKDHSSRALAAPSVSTHINEDSLKTNLNNLLKTSDFNQRLMPPRSQIDLPYFLSDISDIIDIPASGTSSYNSGDIIIHKVYYTDGTTDEPHNRVSLYEYYRHPNAKCIDSLQVEVIVNYPTSIQQISLSKKNPTFGIGDNMLQLTSMKDKEADVLLSKNVYDNLLTIQAKNKKGTVLNYVSNSLSSHYSSAVSTYFQEIAHLSKVIIKDIDEGKYDSLDNLKRDIFDKFSMDAPKNDQDYTIWVQFEKAISQIDIYYVAELDSIKAYGTIINSDLQSAKNPYHTAIDAETYQYGIIDNSGSWITEPQYISLEHIDSLFFRGYKIEDNEDDYYHTYKLDVEAKTLTQYEYNIVDTLSAKYYMISPANDTGKRGLMDKNENVIIPPTKEWVYSPLPGFFTVEDTLTALYDGEGKVLLPEMYSDIYIIDGYIYATQYTDSRRITTIYDLNIHPITKDNWSAATRFSDHSDLVLVEDENDNQFYINKEGEIVISPSGEYIFSDEFWFGSAVVYTEDSNGTRKYGYINVKGNIIIEPQYDFVLPFQGEYAYAEKNGKAMLIDKNNGIYKKLPSTLSSSLWQKDLKGDPANTRYYLDDEVVLDGYGNVVKEIQ